MRVIKLISLAVLIVMIFNTVCYADSGCNWYIVKRGNEVPGFPENADEILKHGGIFIDNNAVNSNEKKIYLTFDAGFENGCTGKILDVLKKHNAHAAFFLVGNYLKTQPDLVRRMVAEGHIVGNHTMTHPDMSGIADESAFRKELEGVETLYREITGQEMAKFYRPPRGVYSRENLEMASKMGYKTVFWSLAYVDWYQNDQPTREQALGKLLPRTHNGAVILLHSTSQTNAEILDELLTEWEKQGYRFASVEELFSDTNVQG